MTKTAKTTAKTTKKGTTMPKTNEPKTNPQDKILALKANYENAVKLAKSLRKRAKKGDVTNFVTGRPVNRDAQQVAALKVVAAVEGYPTNEWATLSQIKANGGKLKADAFGAPMFMPAGEGKLSYYLVFNKAAVEWKDGKVPTTFVTKKATTSKGKKAAAPSGDMSDMVKALMEQNQQLMAALAAALAK